MEPSERKLMDNSIQNPLQLPDLPINQQNRQNVNIQQNKEPIQKNSSVQHNKKKINVKKKVKKANSQKNVQNSNMPQNPQGVNVLQNPQKGNALQKSQNIVNVLQNSANIENSQNLIDAQQNNNNLNIQQNQQPGVKKPVMKKKRKIKKKISKNLNAPQNPQEINSPKDPQIINVEENPQSIVIEQNPELVNIQPIVKKNNLIKSKPIKPNIKPKLIDKDNLIDSSKQLELNDGNPKPKIFRIHQKIMICPHCKTRITTNVQKQFNCKTLIYYIIFIILLPVIIFVFPAIFAWFYNYTSAEEEEELQREEIKDSNIFNIFYDGTHYCPNCEQKVGFYDSYPCKKENKVNQNIN